MKSTKNFYRTSNFDSFTPKKSFRDSKEDELRKTKFNLSSPFFKNTRVLSCSKVLVKNGGKSIAFGFPYEKTGYKAKGSYANFSRSSEVASLSQYFIN